MRKRLRGSSGMGTIVLLVIVIGMVILGGMLIFVAVGDSTADDVAGTSLESAGQITQAGLQLTSGLLPVIVWLMVAAVLVVALVFMYRAFWKKGRVRN